MIWPKQLCLRFNVAGTMTAGYAQGATRVACGVNKNRAKISVSIVQLCRRTKRHIVRHSAWLPSPVTGYRGETRHSLYVWAASGYLSVYWLPLVPERVHPCANWLLRPRRPAFSRSSTQTRQSGRKTIIRQEWCPRPSLEPVLPRPASQLGCEVVWAGPCDGGGDPGACTHGAWELRGGCQARVTGSAASLCS